MWVDLWSFSCVEANLHESFVISRSRVQFSFLAPVKIKGVHARASSFFGLLGATMILPFI